MRRETILLKQKQKEKDDYYTLRHMIRFIEQEGREKAEEVDCRTEEEFNMLKAQVIQTERLKIIKEYNAKELRCKQDIAIAAGRFMQAQRMEMVRAKIEIFNEIQEDVRFQVFQDMETSKRRWNILQRLIMEALFKLLEQEVVIICREIDESMIRKAIPDIETVYQNTTNQKIKVRVDENYLSCCTVLPGVKIRTPDSKVAIENTLDARVDQIMRSSLPVINQVLYGTSKMHK